MSFNYNKNNSELNKFLEKKESISYDEYFYSAGRFIIEKNKASIGMIQRIYKIGFSRAARIMDQLENAGVVSAEEGTKVRTVIMNMQEFEDYIENFDRQDSGVDKEDEEQDCDVGKGDEKQDYDILTRAEIEETAKIFIRNNKVIAKEPEFSDVYVKVVEKLGNCIVPECDYNLPLDFVESLFTGCSPVDLRIILIDPDGIFELYKGFPQLISSPITNEDKIERVLDWIKEEMFRRQAIFIDHGVRDIRSFADIDNADISEIPYIILIIREFDVFRKRKDLLEKLEYILANGLRTGFNIIGFSVYRINDLSLGRVKSIIGIIETSRILDLVNEGTSTVSDQV